MGPTTPRQVTAGQVQPIPTVIAETPARYVAAVPASLSRAAETTPDSRFDAVRPDEPSSAGDRGRSHTDLATHGLATAGGELSHAVRCPSCDRPIPEGHRFCRCGATVTAQGADPDWEDPQEGMPWYRRLRDGLGAGARHWRSIRDANDGARAAYDRAESLKNRAVKMLSAVGVIAIGVGAVSPWGEQTRQQVVHTVSQMLPWSYTTLAADGARANPSGQASDPASTPTPGFEADLAVDRDLGTAWSTRWVAPISTAGEPCARPAGADRLLVTFTQPQQIDRVSVFAGLPAGSVDRVQQSRPKAVAIMLSDGRCEEATLADVATSQPIDISGSGITAVTISVLQVYDGDGTDGAAELVAFTEVVASFR